MRSAFRTAAAAATAALILASGATAAHAQPASPQWLAGDTVMDGPAVASSEHSGSQPIIGSDGAAHVVSIGYVGDVLQVFARIRRPGDDNWQPGVPISQSFAAATSSDIDSPAVTARPGGSIVALWKEWPDGTRSIAASTLTGNEWSEPVTLSDPTITSRSPVVASDTEGNVTAAWVSDDHGDRAVFSARLVAGTTTWSQPVKIPDAEPDDWYGMELVALPDNKVVAVWSEAAGGAAASTFDPGSGTWDTSAALSDSGHSNFGGFAVATNGDLLLSWSDYNDDNQHLRTATRDFHSGTWSTQQLNTTTAWVSGSDVAPLPNGGALMAWAEWGPDDSVTVKQSIRDADSGVWSAPSDLESGFSQLRLHTLADGRVIAVALGSTSGIYTLAFDPDNSRWSEPYALNDSTHDAWNLEAAFDDDGNMLATWTESGDHFPYTGRVALADGAGPSVNASGLPDSVVAGTPTLFTFTATDLWSSLGSATWDFGDGATATGTSATHTFDAAGDYPLTLTVPDTFGNNTVLERNITVSAAAAAPQPHITPPAGPPVITPAPPNKALAPIIEARLTSRTVTLNARVTLRKGKRCTGKVVATTKFGNRTYRTTLRLKADGKTCRATGTIKLKKTPSTRTKLRVKISSSSLKTRTLSTKRA